METMKSEETFEARIAREKQEEKTYKARVESLISEVSKILGFTPQKNRDDSWRYVSLDIKKGEECLHFTSGNYELKDRLKISGNFPRTEKGEYIDPYDYRDKRHEITVSITKTTEQIARDIERRFLPLYRELLNRVIQRVNQSNEYDRTCTENLEEIKGKKLTEEEKKQHRFELHGEIYGEFSVHGDSVKIELNSVPVEMAKKVMQLIDQKN